MCVHNSNEVYGIEVAPVINLAPILVHESAAFRINDTNEFIEPTKSSTIFEIVTNNII